MTTERPPSTTPPENELPGPDPEVAALAQRIRASRDARIRMIQPLSEEANDRITARVLGPPAEGGRVLPLRKTSPLPDRSSKMRRAAWAGASALAIAAGVAGIYMASRGPELPRVAYALEISGDAAVRSDAPPTEGPVRLRPSTHLRARITSSAKVRDKALRVLVVRGGKAHIVTPAYTLAPDGAVVIDAPAREALGDQVDGPADLVFIVGSGLPDDDEIKRLAEDAAARPNGDFNVLRRPATLEGWGTTMRAVEPRDVEFAGCYAVTQGPVCEVTPGAKIRFWVPKAAGAPALSIDGRAADPAREPLQDGTRLTAEIGPGSREAVITGASKDVLLRLPIRPALDLPAVREAFTLMQKNQLDEADSKLQAAERDDRPEAKLQALRKRARLERRRGNIDGAIASLRKAIDEGRAMGRTSDEIEDRQLLGYQEMIHKYDFEAARSDLFEALPLEATCPECRVDGDYYRAVWAGEAGRFEEALRWLRRSQAGAERLQLTEQAAAAKGQLTETLSVLGRRAEVQALVDESLKDAATSADPCHQTRFVTNAAWALFRGADAEDAAARAEKTAAEAVDIARARCAEVLPNALMNLAFVEVKTKHVKNAREHLDEARRAAPKEDARFQSWSEAVAVELDLAEEPAKALSVSSDMVRRGEAAMSPELFFQAGSMRARALDALGRAGDAAEAFASGEAALDQWSARVPLGEGRSAFFTQQDQWSRIAVGFFVRRAEAEAPGSPARAEATRAAADVAQRSLARFFTTLVHAESVPPGELGGYRKRQEAAKSAGGAKDPQRITGRPALKEAHEAALSPIAEGGARANEPSGALTLLYHPVPEGWVGFAIEPGGVITMKRLPRVREEALASPSAGIGDNDLSAALLDPFADPIAHAKTLRFSGPGRLRRIAFESLPWRGGLLADAAAVSYGFDAPVTEADPSCKGSPRALLVTNPRGDLAGAESAGASAQAALLKRGWIVDRLEGPAATRDAVMAALQDPCTGLFHYDGHARFEGRDGLRAALMLQSDALTVSDLLSLPRAPRAVVLLGCATAKDEGLGLAQAFLLRGSREVLATTEEVDDALSLRIAERLYDDAPSAADGAPSLATALRKAARSARGGAGEAQPWWRFRVLTR